MGNREREKRERESIGCCSTQIIWFILNYIHYPIAYMGLNYVYIQSKLDLLIKTDVNCRKKYLNVKKNNVLKKIQESKVCNL